jgi:hypothetical protein
MLYMVIEYFNAGAAVDILFIVVPAIIVVNYRQVLSM